MHTRIDHSGMNIMLDILCGEKRKFFRYYFIYQMDKNTIMLQMGIDEKEFVRFCKIVQYQIKKHLIYKQCEQCHKHYYTPRENSTVCENCKKQSGEKANKKPKGSGIKCPHEILRRMEKYNKKHNTNLSYGYYVFISGE